MATVTICDRCHTREHGYPEGVWHDSISNLGFLCEALSLPEEVEEFATHIVFEATTFKELRRLRLNSITAAALYIVALLKGLRIQQTIIANAFSISPGTLSKTYQRILEKVNLEKARGEMMKNERHKD